VNNHPPKLPLRFFRWYCHQDFAEDIEGDLLERFETRIEEKGIRSAKRQFSLDIIRLFRPGLIRSLEGHQKLNKLDMLKINLTLGFRNLIKRKEYAIINTLGLAIGIASALLIFLFVQNEFSYDKSFKNSDRIYKMVQQVSNPDGTELYATVPYSLVSIMINDYAEVENGTAISGPYDSQVVSMKDENDNQVNFIENSVLLADSNFFSVFSFRMLKGNIKTALNKPNSVVLTVSTAKRFFGNANPLGRFIAPSGKHSIVTGVCEDPPPNSHLQFNYIVSSSSVRWFSQDQFNLSSAHCYFKLRTGADAKDLELKLPRLIDTYVLEEIERTKNISRQDYKKAGNGFEYFLKPLTSIHLADGNLGGFKPGGNLTTVRILIVIGILILIIACINFMNLATARATERAREVGVRKVMGSQKTQLIFQFLTESFIITLLSVMLGIAITILALPYFNSLTDNDLSLIFSFKTMGGFVFLAMIISIMAGIYPAFVLSSFIPVSALKGSSLQHSKTGWLRNGLVLFQFWIAVVLIISTIIIHKQVSLLRDKNLGFDQEQLMVIEGIAHKETEQYIPFLNEIRNFPQIQGAAGSLWVQGFQGTWSDTYRHDGSSEQFDFSRVMIGDQFAEVVNFELKEGQLFSESTNDSLSIILNESAVKSMGLQDPIGQKIMMVSQDKGEMNELGFTIKGVIKDFNYNSLYRPIEPLVIHSDEFIYDRMRFIVAKVKAGSNAETITQIESKWNELLPDRPFSFRFLDDTLNAKYQTEQRTATILMIFSGLTIFIACLGLFALSSYSINMRIKEIGIRKVLGAKAQNIVLLLSKDFVKMVLLSFLLAIPVALFVGATWLEDFAYRIDISSDIFILSGVLVFLVTGLTVGIQTFKAANTYPIDSLKNE
jgi:putative ABC transport system permease protein